ncbi:MAG: type secretion system baseplate subunit TssF, partial [Pseudomonadota bacterium]
EMGAEFAREFPKVAGRLGIDGTECADPYVERLLEAFGFMAARIQLKIDSEFPRFTQHLLELICPHYLVPTPSMAVVQLAPNLLEGALAAGFPVPTDTVLRSRLGKGEQTPCEYRTKHPLQLWPIELHKAEYTTLLSELRDLRVPGPVKPKALLRLTLRATAGLTFDQLALDRLPLFLAGDDEVALRLYEQLVAGTLAVVARSTKRPMTFSMMLDDQPGLRPLGLDDESALLPYGSRSFQGYRLLHEYFAFPSRYMFVELTGLSQAMRQCRESEIELLIMLDREDPSLEGIVDAQRLLPFCTPVINLFPREVDRIHLTDREHEYHVVADRTRPLDLEVYRIDRVVGHGARATQEREFLPLYAAGASFDSDKPQGFYTIQRVPRSVSSQRRRIGPRSTYVGSEVFVSLVDADQGPFAGDLRQLSVQALCTNRDLPLHMSLGHGDTDFRLQSGAPVETVRCVAGPSAPRASHAHGDTSWRLISHLTLNYLTLADTDQRAGAAALRELLALYADLGDPSTRKQVQGVQSIRSAPVMRPLPGAGPLTFGRGLEITFEADEAAFQGGGAFLLASVLERFFAKYVSINSFTETVLRTLQRGEIMRWQPISGQRHQL